MISTLLSIFNGVWFEYYDNMNVVSWYASKKKIYIYNTNEFVLKHVQVYTWTVVRKLIVRIIGIEN